MKKIMTIVLAVMLLMSVAVPAFAASPTAPEATTSKTSPLPVVVEEGKEDASCILYSIYDADELTEEECTSFKEAQKALKKEVPAGMRVKYFFYHQPLEATAAACEHTLDIGNFTEVIVKQYLEGKWVELDVKVNENGTITISGIETGPMAIIVK